MPAVPVSAVTDQSAVVLTAIINKLQKPSTFLYNILYRNAPVRYVETGQYQIDIKNGVANIAPLTRTDGEAKMLTRGTGDVKNGTLPNIRMKMPISYNEDLYKRLPGMISGGGLIRPGEASYFMKVVAETISADAQNMLDAWWRRQEWFAAKLLAGAVSYSDTDGTNFAIDLERPVGNTSTPGTKWNDDACTPRKDMVALKLLASTAQTSLRLGICNDNMANKLLASVEAGQLKWDEDNLKNTYGTNTTIVNHIFKGMDEDFDSVYLGRLGGVEVWCYNGVDLDDGTTPFVPNDTIRCFNPSTRSRIIMYAPIPKATTKGIQLVRTRKLSWAKPKDDPVSFVQYLESREFPFETRADWVFDIVPY